MPVIEHNHDDGARPWAYVPPPTAAETELRRMNEREAERLAWIAGVQAELRQLRDENTALRAMLEVRGVTPAQIAAVSRAR